MRDEKFTGSYGIVIRPDPITIKKAEQLALMHAPQASYKVEIAHITLYHANFEKLPKDEIQKILWTIRALIGQTLKLQDLQIFGSKFLFWNIIKTEWLQQAHEQALQLSKFLDSKAQARALEENLSLTDKEMQNLKAFGHPLIRELYLPHITLAYNSDGISMPNERLVEHSMKIESIDFAKIGEQGSISRIIRL